MPTQAQLKRDLVIAFLEIEESTWGEYKSRRITKYLVPLVERLVDLQDDLEDFKRFFLDLKEMEVVQGFEGQLSHLDKVRQGLDKVLGIDHLDKKDIRALLNPVRVTLQKVHRDLRALETELVSTIRKKTVEAKITKSTRSYRSKINSFWPKYREALVRKIEKYFRDSEDGLMFSHSYLVIPESPVSVLQRVEKVLRERSQGVLAEHIKEKSQEIRKKAFYGLNLIPGHVGAPGNWKVKRTDCPNPKVPAMEGLLGEKFAFCAKTGERCPAFEGSKGSYVQCASLKQKREADFIGDITPCEDKKYLKVLRDLAPDDPYLQMLLNRGEDLYWAEKIDPRLEDLLDQYPVSNKNGNGHAYRVYVIGGKPLYMSRDYLMATSKELLEQIIEGVIVPSKLAKVVKVADPAIRITFSALALSDSDFRDFLRKKDATLSGRLTWDIPYSREDDIQFILDEIKEEFGYKVFVMEMVEDVHYSYRGNRMFGRDFTATTKVYPGSRSHYSPNSLDIEAAATLSSLSEQVPSELKERVSHVADCLRLVRTYSVFSYQDAVVHNDGSIGILPGEGDRIIVPTNEGSVEAIVEGSAVAVEGGVGYYARSTKDGSSLTISVEGACPMTGPQDFPSFDPGNPPPPDAFHYLNGEEDGPIRIIMVMPEPLPGYVEDPMLPPPPTPECPSCGPALSLPPPPTTSIPVTYDDPGYSDYEPALNSDGMMDLAQEYLAPGIRLSPKNELRFPSGDFHSSLKASTSSLGASIGGLPYVNDVRNTLSHDGNPVLLVLVNDDLPEDNEIPSTFDGFNVRVQLDHESPEADHGHEEEQPKVAIERLLDPAPGLPQNGSVSGREAPPGPNHKQVGIPPTENDPLIYQTKNIPKQ